MANTRKAATTWNGGLADGNGKVSLQSSGIGTYDVTWAARTEEPNGKTSPEELIAAAHSACFSMALSHALAQQGNPPSQLDVEAAVGFQAGKGITGIHLTVQGSVEGMDADDFV